MPGSLLFLYSGGLVEQRGHEIDEGLARLTTLLDRHRDVSCQRLVDTVVERLAADAADDVVVLALRIPWAPGDESAFIGRTHRAGHPAPGAGAVATRT